MEKHSLNSFVGKRIRQRRNIAGLSQREMGKRLGVTSQQIQKYEKGTNRISVSGLYEMAKILKATPQYFMDGFDETTDRKNDLDEIFGSGAEAKDAVNMVRYFVKIKDQATRKHILYLVKSISED